MSSYTQQCGNCTFTVASDGILTRLNDDVPCNFAECSLLGNDITNSINSINVTAFGAEVDGTRL